MHELANNLERVEHYIGAYTTTQTPSNGIDLQGLRNPTLYAYIGAIAAGSPQGTWAFKLEHSDTVNADFAAVAETDVVLGPGCDAFSSGTFYTSGNDGSPAPTDDSQMVGITYKGSKRYVRVVATAADTPGSTVMAVFCLAEPALKPALT